MESPFEIDAESGTLRFPQFSLNLAPKLRLEDFLATDIGASARQERSNNGRKLYSFRLDLPDNRKLAVSLAFVGDCLAKIRFDYRSEREYEWSNWSQERELALVREYQVEIVRQLERRGHFEWGVADAGYDDKAASAVLFVHYH